MVKNKTKESSQTQQLINFAIQKGINALVENHPAFKENRDYILRHIDTEKINEKFEEIYGNLKEKNWNSEEKIKYLQKEIADYIATGAAFDESGKEIILKKSLEEKAKSGFFKGFFARRSLEGEKYLDNTIEAFQELYALFKSGNYTERMPEIAEAVSTVYDMGFLNPAIDVLKQYGLIDERGYRSLKKGIHKKTEESSKKVVGGIESYLIPHKVAASILGVFGVFLVAFNSKITGAVIGTNPIIESGVIGGIMLLISLLLFLKRPKK